MSQEKCVLYLTCEVWMNESGSLGWALRDPDGSQVDIGKAATIFLEMGETLLTHPNGACASIILWNNNNISTRRQPDIDFFKLRHYIWLKDQLRRSVFMQMGIVYKSSPRMELLWSISWLWHKALGHFRGGQTAALPGGGTGTSSVTDMLSERSEGVPAQSQQAAGGGVVLPFPERRK